MTRLDRQRMLIAGAPACQLVLVGPLRVLAANPDFVNVAPWTLVGIASLSFLVVFAVLAGFLALIRHRLAAAAVCVVAVVAFLEQVVLLRLARHGAFDGTEIDWLGLRGLAAFELLIAAGVIGLLVLPRVRLGHLALVAQFLLVFQLAGLAASAPELWRVAIAKGPILDERGQYFHGFAELSAERNIIHMVADHTQGALTFELLQKNIDHYGPLLDGFTMFTQASGRYPSTYPSISYYMTGRSPEPEADVVDSFPLTNELVRTTLAEHSVVNALARAGFETYGAPPTSLYCAGDYVACLPIDILSGRPEGGVRADTLGEFLRLLDVSLFQSSPVLLRRRVHQNGQWFLSRRMRRARTVSGVLDEFMDRLTVADSVATYNYLHHPGGHPPIQFDADCVFIGTQAWTRESTAGQITCYLNQVTALVARLKRLGVYDQTMILIHGDHGSQWPTPLVSSTRGSLVPSTIIGMANPLVLAKPPDTHGPLRFSSAPVSLRDVPVTLANAFGVEGTFPGTPMMRLAENAFREREFLYYQPGVTNIYREGDLGRTLRYRIRGNLFDPFDWIPPIRADLKDAANVLSSVDPRFKEYSQGFGRQVIPSRPNWRYVEGRLARAYLGVPAVGSAVLELRAQLPESLEEQTLELWIDGQRVAVMDGAELRERKTHRIPLAAALEAGRLHVVELRLANIIVMAGYDAPVSLRFHSVGLVSLDGSEES